VSDLLVSALVSAGVTGVLVFSYQQWLQARIRRVEAKLERQRSYEQQTHELLVAAYKRIWQGLVEIEYWLRHELWNEITSHPEVDPERWTVFYETYKSFRAEMLFLPDPIYDRTIALIRQVEVNLNGLLDALREVIEVKAVDPEGYATDPRLVMLVNSARDKVTGDYRDGLDELRRDYQAISRDLLMGGEIPERMGDRG
jgi:hypothetical protein